ncbi:response regulator [Thalassomonas viridans]|uniref:Sensor protein FixL n=1 Tax=Thalassomonas viridans TaxID=137584 RepID=A0AAE9Z2J8_9GAMM|nr:response regulator [Thalassomonas viridans]WDE04037.1 response regulator [Thalassomonas viridans]
MTQTALSATRYRTYKLLTQISRRKHYFWFVLLICVLPIVLNFSGLDFSSPTLDLSSVNEGEINDKLLFSAVAGAFHHALLEWSSVVFAFLVFLASILHYRIRGDIAIPVIGIAIFCAGLVDAFHILAASRIIAANAENTDFVPFTWALSRTFNAVIISLGALVCLWFHRRALAGEGKKRQGNHELRILLAIGACFISFAYTAVHLSAVSDNLPQTMFTGTLLARPYDILPLGLYIVAATLCWNLYCHNPSLARLGFLLSIMPQATTQLHMAFGSSALFDNHFNIAHALKIFTYACVLWGIIADLYRLSLSSSNTQQQAQTQPGTESPASVPNRFAGPENLLEVGQARHSLGLQIPMAAFILSVTIVVLVSLMFYVESKRLLLTQETKKLAIEAKLVEPLIEQFYAKAYSDVLFLSNTPPIMGLVKAKTRGDQYDYDLWKERLEQIFAEFIYAKPYYLKIRYIGVADNGRELVNVSSFSRNKPVRVPKAKLRSKASQDYFSATLEKNLGQVYFSDITLNKEYGVVARPYQPVVRAATPIFHPDTGAVFGLVIISVDFNSFIEELNANELSGLALYIANDQGDYIVHPDSGKTFGFELRLRYLMQDEFPQLADVIASNVMDKDLVNFEHKGILSSGHYARLLLDKFDNQHSLRLLVLRDNQESLRAFAQFKEHSLILGVALAFVALALSVIAARRIANPLVGIITTLENHDKTGALGNLPVNSGNEIGVLARSFHNLFARMNSALTQQMVLANEAEQAVNKLNAVFDSAADAFITLDSTGEIQSFNRAAESIFGYRQEEVIGRNARCLMPEPHASQDDVFLGKYIKTGVSDIMGVGRELEARRKSGEIFPIHLAISEVKTTQGYIFTGIIRDISAEKRLKHQRELTELALKQANTRISIATDSAGIGIWEYDLVNDVLIWDDWMFRLYGIEKKDFGGGYDDWKDSLHPDDRDSTEQAVKAAIEQHMPYEHEFRIVLNSGEIKYIKAAARVNYDDEGYAVLMTGVNYDISKRKEAEATLIQARELAEDTVRHKAEFLASMSHEIRTPMNGVLGMLGLLMRSDLSEQQYHRVKLATSSAESLLTIINDILDFSKVEAGKLDLEIIDFNLLSLLGEFTESMAFKAQEKGLEIILDVSNIRLSHVKGDPGRLRQVLTNLVSNAVKFTSRGEILICAEVFELNEQQVSFCCSVKDTGIGIPEEKLTSIFDSFTQVDASTTREYGGTGLGLAISKQLCQLMQGDIRVSSEVGRGSCFTFEVVLEISECSSVIIPQVNIKGVDLLVVDDNQTNRLVLKEQLALWGARVSEAKDGLEALALLQRRDRPDFKVAFLDMQMPYMDGAELGRRIRALDELNDLKLVMMTSMASRGDASYFAGIGFDAYFPKPATLSDLFDTLALTLTDDETSAGQRPLITHHFLQGLNYEQQKLPLSEHLRQEKAHFEAMKHCRLLLVEDNRINQEVASHILAEYGIKADIACDGLQALASLRMAAPDMPYDLILMDCQMPEMDGYQATREIRRGSGGEVHKDIPIIAMTANAMKGDKEKCLEAGMSDYLAKPIKGEFLKKKLLAWYRGDTQDVSDRDEQTGAIEAVKFNTELGTQEKLKLSLASSKTLIWNKQDLLLRVKQNTEFGHKLLQLFLKEMPPLIDHFSQVYQRGGTEEMLNCLDKIKEMTLNICAMAMHEKTCRAVTALAADGLSEEVYRELLLSYQMLHQRLSEELELCFPEQG